jgi:5'-nucleotidase / UDP-sugar diphosphatase
MRKLLLLLVFAAHASAATVTLLQFSDYHSHALPFTSDEGPSRGGFARAIRYLEREHARGALVFSGGDMVNKGSPAWSDRYTCAEWPWLNGVVDAMALGNHDPDYGLAALDQCRALITYPILSANTAGFQRYEVFSRNGIRIGVFALAGPDFPSLVHTPGLRFDDRIAAAREVVHTLREVERVDAVVMIGHEQTADDYALANMVPGIDVIFGSHSHEKHEFTKIPETPTYFLAPSQYLTYISRVTLTFSGHKLTRVDGGLVPVDERMQPDRRIAARIARMQRALEHDPRYAALFQPIAKLRTTMSVASLAQFTLNAMRDAAHADVALSTVSSFRQPLPAGTITLEDLRNAMPYDNDIVVCTMRGDAVRALLAGVEARRGSDAFAYVAKPDVIDPAKTYRVATTDYMARIAYKPEFASCDVQKSGFRVREEVRKRL